MFNNESPSFMLLINLTSVVGDETTNDNIIITFTLSQLSLIQ